MLIFDVAWLFYKDWLKMSPRIMRWYMYLFFPLFFGMSLCILMDIKNWSEKLEKDKEYYNKVLHGKENNEL